MRIKQEDRFKSEFRNILEYIAKDNLSAAKKFKKNLIKEIKKIPEYPYKYRSSNYINDKQVRDMIFKGYTIIYRIEDNTIQILTIFNQNLPVF